MNKIKNEQKNKKVIMKMNELLGKKKSIQRILIIMDVILFVLVHITYNLIASIFNIDIHNMDNLFSLKNLLSFEFFRIDFYITFLFLIVCWDLYIAYKLRVNYSMDIFNIGQKGKQRFTTLDEIKEQYKEIPEKDVMYQGEAGFLVSRHEDKIYIDTSPVNNMIIGMTRSGKGECLIFPLIDIYSRAEEQPSMIITDIKLDMYPKAKKTLEERGYDVHLYNLITPGMSTFRFNPLSIIVDEMDKGNVSDAENICNSFCYSVYFSDGQPDSGDATFFANTSTQLVSAAILALTTDCLEEDKKLNVSRLDAFERKQMLFKRLKEEEKETARKIYQICVEEDPEKAVWNVDYIPDDKEFIPTYRNRKKINLLSLVNAFTELARIQISPKMTLLDFYFQSRPALDRAKFLYSSVEVSGERTKGNIMSNALSKLVTFTYKDIAQLTAESTIKIEDIGFGDKPLAIFIAIPDFDRSKDFYLSIFNRQIYYVLAKKASEQSNGRTRRKVKFIWDEFGNMPAVDNADSMITSGLGRGISFDLVIQAYSQLDDKYGKKADTIRSNCGNKMYLLTDDIDTARNISESLGSETITTANRMGSKFSLNKTITESWDEKQLIPPNELMNFRQGEAVLIRTMKRTDLNGNDIISYPIYNCPENGTRLKYRYTYLTDTFPDNISYVDLIQDELKKLDMTERVWDYKQVYSWFEKEQSSPLKNDEIIEKMDGTLGTLMTYRQIEKILKMQSVDTDRFNKEMSLDEFICTLSEIEMDPKIMKQIFNLIERGM